MNEYGNTVCGVLSRDILVKEVQYSDSLEDSPSGTITCSFAGTLTEARAAAPELGSFSELFPETSIVEGGGTYTRRIALKKRQFSLRGDDAGTVAITLSYGVYESDADSQSELQTSYTVQGTEQSQSLLAHPKFAKLEQKELLLANALISGTKPYETVYLSKQNLEIRTSVSDKEDREANWTEMTLKDAIDKYVTSADGKKLIAKIANGVTQYKSCGCSFTETKYSTGMQGAVNELGKISSPPGSAPSGGSWLLTGLSAKKNRGESRWEIVRTWTAADNGEKWDEDLYSEK